MNHFSGHKGPLLRSPVVMMLIIVSCCDRNKLICKEICSTRAHYYIYSIQERIQGVLKSINNKKGKSYCDNN